MIFCKGVSQLFTLLFFTQPLSNLRPPLPFGSSPFVSLFSQREVLRPMLRGKNEFAKQSIQEQATCSTFFQFSVENKTFLTKMTGGNDVEKMIRGAAIFNSINSFLSASN